MNYLLILALLLVPVNSSAWWLISEQKVSSAGATCETNFSEYVDVSGSWEFTRYIGSLYKGFSWDTTTATDICGVTFSLGEAGGDISGNNYKAIIYNMDGNNLLSKVVESELVSGSTFTGGSATDVKFMFSSPITITSGQAVVVALDDGAGGQTVDGVNFIDMYGTNNSADTDQSSGTWRGDNLLANTYPQLQERRYILWKE